MRTIAVLRGTAAIAASILLSACAKNVNPFASPNIEQRNSKPAGINELTIDAQGNRMPGHIYLAAGHGPHPTAIMLHGYPGNEKNLDVAQALREAGWNALFFHYRGAWGSEGQFSFIGSEVDVQTVIDYAQKPENYTRLKIDPHRISLVGHSMGGHMAVAGILDNRSVKCAVAHDGANMGADGKGIFTDQQSIKLWSDYSDSLFMLNGWSGKKAIAEIAEHGSRIDLVTRSKSINQRPVKLIAADTDVIPVHLHIKPLYAALQQYSDNIDYQLIDDDHSFSNSRDLLIHSTIDFLNENCR